MDRVYVHVRHQSRTRGWPLRPKDSDPSILLSTRIQTKRAIHFSSRLSYLKSVELLPFAIVQEHLLVPLLVRWSRNRNDSSSISISNPFSDFVHPFKSKAKYWDSVGLHSQPIQNSVLSDSGTTQLLNIFCRFPRPLNNVLKDYYRRHQIILDGDACLFSIFVFM